MATIFRPATPKDAPFVALVMAEAIGDDIMERTAVNGNRFEYLEKDRARMELLTSIAARADTLYSYVNTLLATDEEGHYLGGLIAYPGNDYAEKRMLTFGLVGTLIDFDVEAMDLETLPGEYYLDSLAVMPEYRGRGIARKLLQYGIEQGRARGEDVVLACSPENPRAYALYRSLGFEEACHIFIFGEDYIKLKVKD